MTGYISWNGSMIAYQTGESLASALSRAGILDLGRAPTGQARAVFCGIGQCQNCLVCVVDRLTEACLLVCHDGLIATQDHGASHD